MTLQDSGKKMSCLASAVSHNSVIMKKNVEELMFLHRWFCCLSSVLVCEYSEQSEHL